MDEMTLRDLLDDLKDDTDMFLQYCKELRIVLIDYKQHYMKDERIGYTYNGMILKAFRLFYKLIYPQLGLGGLIDVELHEPRNEVEMEHKIILDHITFNVQEKIPDFFMEKYLNILGDLGEALQWAYLICDWDDCDFFRFSGKVKLKTHKATLKNMHDLGDYSESLGKIGDQLSSYGPLDGNLMSIISKQIGSRKASTWPAPYRPKFVSKGWFGSKSDNYTLDMIDDRNINGRLNLWTKRRDI